MLDINDEHLQSIKKEQKGMKVSTYFLIFFTYLSSALSGGIIAFYIFDTKALSEYTSYRSISIVICGSMGIIILPYIRKYILLYLDFEIKKKQLDFEYKIDEIKRRNSRNNKKVVKPNEDNKNE